MTVDPNVNSTSSNVSPTTSTTSATPAPSAPTTSTGSSGTVSSVSTMQELKATAPQVYKAMMQGIAIQICNRSQDFQEQMQEYEQDALADDN